MTSGLRYSAVADPEQERLGAVLGHRQHRHVADEAAVEVAGGGVVDQVLVAPARERREDEQSERGAEPTRWRACSTAANRARSRGT